MDIADDHCNKGVLIEEKVCYSEVSEVEKEEESMELGCGVTCQTRFLF